MKGNLLVLIVIAPFYLISSTSYVLKYTIVLC
jgi:hypothetical protein